MYKVLRIQILAVFMLILAAPAQSVPVARLLDIQGAIGPADAGDKSSTIVFPLDLIKPLLKQDE